MLIVIGNQKNFKVKSVITAAAVKECGKQQGKRRSGKILFSNGAENAQLTSPGIVCSLRSNGTERAYDTSYPILRYVIPENNYWVHAYANI